MRGAQGWCFISGLTKGGDKLNRLSKLLVARAFELREFGLSSLFGLESVQLSVHTLSRGNRIIATFYNLFEHCVPPLASAVLVSANVHKGVVVGRLVEGYATLFRPKKPLYWRFLEGSFVVRGRSFRSGLP
jgi:hypothetical protein